MPDFNSSLWLEAVGLALEVRADFIEAVKAEYERTFGRPATNDDIRLAEKQYLDDHDEIVRHVYDHLVANRSLKQDWKSEGF